MSLKKEKLAILGLGLLNTVIHLACYNTFEYHRDELLYFSLGMHPDFGFATVPPLIGWVATVMQAFFGFSIFAVKLFPALLGGVFVVLGCLTARELGGKFYAQVVAGIAIIIMPITLRTFYLFQPVHLDLFFWTLILYYVLRFVNTENDKYLVVLGVVFGIALLNKYLVALLFPALLIPVLFTRHRAIFSRKMLYLGFALGFLIFLPNLVWQIQKGIPLIHHMGELKRVQLVHVDRVGFLIEQLLNPGMAGFVVIPGFIFLWMNKTYRFLFFSVLFVILSLFLLHGKSYYTQGVFPFLAAAGSVLAEQSFRKKIFRYSFPVFLIVMSLPIIPMGIPIYKPEKMVKYFKMLEDKYGVVIGRKFEDGSIHPLPQDYADQLGWEELAKITSDVWQKIPAKNKAFIFCENYGQAGAIDVIGKKYGVPEPVCFNESFFYWKPLRFDPDIEYLVYINGEPGEEVKALFQKIEKAGSITNINAREYGTSVYLCSEPRYSFNEAWVKILSRYKE
jgi:hypothetical protein